MSLYGRTKPMWQYVTGEKEIRPRKSKSQEVEDLIEVAVKGQKISHGKVRRDIWKLQELKTKLIDRAMRDEVRIEDLQRKINRSLDSVKRWRRDIIEREGAIVRAAQDINIIDQNLGELEGLLDDTI